MKALDVLQALKAMKVPKVLKALKAMNELKALKALKAWKQHPPTQPQIHLVKVGSPKGGMWTSPANETAHKFCKGDIRPRGQWPKC